MMKVIDLTARFSKGVVTFKSEPWKLSEKARAAIEEIEAQQRRSWREIMTGNFWLD
jgi:hypothetical protein